MGVFRRSKGWGFPPAPRILSPPCGRPLPSLPMFPSRSPFGTPATLLTSAPRSPPSLSTHLPWSPRPPEPCSRIPGPRAEKQWCVISIPGFPRGRGRVEFRVAAEPPFSSLGPLVQWRILSPRRGGRNPRPGVSCARSVLCAEGDLPRGWFGALGVSRGLP